ncbi:unnamed protein product, partial [Rotaria sordida]
NIHSLFSITINHRGQTHLHTMTSYSALKRKVKSLNTSSSIPRFQVNLEHVLGFTSMSNSLIGQDHSTVAYAAGRTVILFNKNTHKQDFVISTACKTITSLSLSPDGQYLATGECGHNPKVRIWDLTGDRKSCIELGDHKFAIDSVCFSPKVDRLVSIGSLHDGNIYVWNWRNKKKLTSNRCLGSIHRVAFAEDGSYFVTVGIRHVKFWYSVAKSTSGVVPLRGHDVILGESRNNHFIDVVCGRKNCTGLTYVLTANGLICQFDENRKLRADKKFQEKTNCLAISDSYLVVGCDKGVVYILSSEILENIMSVPLPHCLGIDINFIGSIDQMTYPQKQNISFPNTIAVCLDENKSLLTCFYNDHSFYIWNIRNGREIEKRDCYMYHSACIWGIETYSIRSTSPATFNRLSFITCSADNTVRFWSLGHNETRSTFASLPVENVLNRHLMKIIYLDEDYSKLCDNPTTQEKPESTTKLGGRCMKMAPDGLSLTIGDLNGNIRIFDMKTFKQIAFIVAHDNEVLSIDYGQSTDTNVIFLASSSRDRFVHIFDVSKDYQLVTTLDDHSGAVTAIRFTDLPITSDLQLISCGADKSLIFRSISKNENGKYQFLRSHHVFENQTFYDLTVDRSHELVHTVCQDRMIRTYYTKDAKRARACRDTTSDSTSYLIKIDINPSGKCLATSCSNRCVYLWDATTAECIASLYGHGEIVTDLKFSDDGHHLYTVAGDSCIFVWNIRELLVASSSYRSISAPPLKTNDCIVIERIETISQTSNLTEARQQQTNSQQSFRKSSQPGSISNESEFSDSQLRSFLDKEVIDKTISPQHNDSVFIEEDDDDEETADNIVNSTVEMNSFFNENYNHEYSTINAADASETSKPLFQRQDSISSRFSSLSIQMT